METEEKINLLMSMAADDRDSRPPNRNGDNPVLRPINIRQLKVRNGGTIPIMRILLTNACSLNCGFCPMRRDRNLPRTALEPGRLARIYMTAYRKRWARGLFITTGIPGSPVRVMDQLLEMLELLRHRYRYPGYVHVKVPPGAEQAQIERAALLANRLSVNLEAACQETLSQIAPEKSLKTNLAILKLANRSAREHRGTIVGQCNRRRQSERFLRPALSSGMTTQFVVGAGRESDRSILELTDSLYQKRWLHHTHFSAFRPIRNTPLETAPETPVVREHRLYQADYLLREYGFAFRDIVFDREGNLPLEIDPKVAWAEAHPERFPVEIKTASCSALLRVPGIGPRSADRIVTLRRSHSLRSLADLRRLGVVAKRAASFLTLNGRCFGRLGRQLRLWSASDEVMDTPILHEFSHGTFR